MEKAIPDRELVPSMRERSRYHGSKHIDVYAGNGLTLHKKLPSHPR